MGLLETLGRIPKIMEANINALLDKCEDPAKMIDQLLIDYKRDLAEVKRDTAEVMADLKLAEKHVEDCKKEIDRKQLAATNALKAGNEEDARKLLAMKKSLESTLASYQENYEVCKKNADMMRDGYNKLVSNIEELERRKDAAKAKIKLAEAQEKITKASSVANSNKSMEAFSKYEQRAEKALASAQAAAELDAATVSDEDLTEKYTTGADVDVENDLAELKKQLGM